MKKNEAIDLINKLVKKNMVTNYNTSFANVNKSKPVWWLNINPDKFNYDLFLLLVKRNHLYVFHIPSKKILNPTTKFRLKGKLLDIEIGTNLGYDHFRDVKSGGTKFNFKPYLIEKVEF